MLTGFNGNDGPSADTGSLCQLRLCQAKHFSASDDRSNNFFGIHVQSFAHFVCIGKYCEERCTLH